MPKRALILAGGGLKVGFQAGVLQVWLDETGLQFDHADGASGGCFNLTMIQAVSSHRVPAATHAGATLVGNRTTGIVCTLRVL